MKESRGCVLNIGSINAYTGERNLLAYSVSKGALMTLSRNLADCALLRHSPRQSLQRRLGADAERVQTRSTMACRQNWPDEVEPQFAPSGRIMKPEEIAAAAVYWLSRRKPADQRQRGGAGAVSDHRPQSHETRRLMPKLAAFPKAYMDPLCVDGAMTIREWIELAATLGVEGWSFTAGFLELKDRAVWKRVAAGSRRIMG